MLLDIASAVNPKDPFRGRRDFQKGLPGQDYAWNSQARTAAIFGNDEYATCFAIACDNLRAVGVELILKSILHRFLLPQTVLSRAVVAERYAAVGAFIESASNAVSPVIPGNHIAGNI